MRLTSLRLYSAVVGILSTSVAAISADATTNTVSSAFLPTKPLTVSPPQPAPEGMVWIPGGDFSMGCDVACEGMCFQPGTTQDALPVHQVRLQPFWMDATEVTNAQFEKFAKATGYVTIAERTPTKEEFPDAPPENLVAGSTVFTPSSEPVPLNNHYQWWRYQRGANWRHPGGPETNLDGRENYPVVQIAYDDALAYSEWAGKRMPTEAEWEFAARGGLTGQVYAWGNEFRPGGKHMANTYQGKFPVADTGEDGYAGIAPVKSYKPNGYGLYDVAGNVWEWCSDWYRPDYYRQLSLKGSITPDPEGPDTPFDPLEPTEKKRVHRGGSFLCTDEYCTRYMVGTRGKGETNTATDHLGFRCVKSAK
ncbi:MAG: formylglycine-generating enzyme family protein [Candidatus Sumerlaeaceae bacterium]